MWFSVIISNMSNKEILLEKITISAWNIHGLGDKINDEFFLDKIKSDINILLETWRGESKEYKIPEYSMFSKSRKKRKKAKRHSGGIIVYYRKSLGQGISVVQNGSFSENRMWIRLDKSFFGFQNDIYLCTVYIPPMTSTHYDNDILSLENEISIFSNKGKVLLLGDFNARTGNSSDFIENDSTELNNFDFQNILPENYIIDNHINRNNQDKTCNSQGKDLLELCMSSRLRILNGRYVGDTLGYFTCMTSNGYSCVDYAIISDSLLTSVEYFTTEDFNYLSDHVQIVVHLKCKIENNKVLSTHQWENTKSYKWNEKSKNILSECLVSEDLKNQIIDFESKSFSENQMGINEATKELSLILSTLTEKSCRLITKRNKRRQKKIKQKWSDISVYEYKKTLNHLGKQLKITPFNNAIKQKYFGLLKSFRTIVRHKKQAYKQKMFNKLSSTINKNPKEFWNILKTLKDPKEREDAGSEEIFKNIEKTIKHFQNQGECKNINEGFKKEIEHDLNKLEESIEYNVETDTPITIREIKNVLNNLKKGKSGGPDSILNEVIKFSSSFTLKAYAKVFNLIMKTGYYPEIWNKSYLVPIHKSGNKDDPSNYRGISLINCLSKVFSAILNKRLIKLMENQFSNSQFGFRENHRTTDSLFILKTLINKYIHKNRKKIYACFVDLQKAFDSVWRNGLLYKLIKTGMGKYMYNIIKNQFSNTLFSIKTDNMNSEYFQTNRGVRQGDSISPTLFNIFINDLSLNFESDESCPLKLINSRIGSLLFADDLLILSESKEGLQNSLNQLSKFCDNWQVTLNIKKTKTMIFQQNLVTPKTNPIFYKNEQLENVSEYKFLGSVLKSNGNLKSSMEDLAKKARKVMFSLKSHTMSLGDLPINVSTNLFDTLVKPILTFNLEVSYMDHYISQYKAKCRAEKSNKIIESLHFIDKSCVEKVHLNFCKYILCTKKSSSNVAVRAELGRAPLEKFIFTQTITYLARLHTENINPLLKESFNLSKELHSQNIYSWYTYAEDIVPDVIKTKLENVNNTKDIQKIKTEVKKVFTESYNTLYDTKIQNFDDKNKLFLYKQLKSSLSKEFYLSSENFEHRKLITKFRISDHNLEIEKGRYYKIPREQRLCKSCETIEDEKHFILKCKLNESLRKATFQNYTNENSNFTNLTDDQKLLFILCPASSQQVKITGSFLIQSLKLRSGD